MLCKAVEVSLLSSHCCAMGSDGHVHHAPFAMHLSLAHVPMFPLSAPMLRSPFCEPLQLPAAGCSTISGQVSIRWSLQWRQMTLTANDSSLCLCRKGAQGRPLVGCSHRPCSTRRAQCFLLPMCAFHLPQFTAFDLVFLPVQVHQPWEPRSGSDNRAMLYGGFSAHAAFVHAPILLRFTWNGLELTEF